MMGSKIATGINTHSGQIVIQEPDGRVSDLNTATNYQRFNAELKSFAQNRGVSPIHMQLHFMND